MQMRFVSSIFFLVLLIQFTSPYCILQTVKSIHSQKGAVLNCTVSNRQATGKLSCNYFSFLCKSYMVVVDRFDFLNAGSLNKPGL